MPREARIFIAEDEAAVRRLLRRMLEMHGHSVVLEAGSLPEALENVGRAKALGVNVAVLDGSLDGSPGDGPKIAESLRREDSGIKIVSFSGEVVSWGDHNFCKPNTAELSKFIESI